jgi:hypothetical protein
VARVRQPLRGGSLKEDLARSCYLSVTFDVSLSIWLFL